MLGQFRQQGQAGIIAVAVTVLVALVITTMSLSQLSLSNAQRSIVTKKTLQTYYVAMAGIQEAHATKFVPGSNKCYLINDAVDCPTQYAGHLSGRAYADPITRAQLMGIYRYIVVGGNPARRTNGTLYTAADGNPNNSNVPYLSTMSVIQDQSPFYIISQGSTCLAPGGTVMPNVIAVNNTTGIPSCPNGTTLDQMVIVTLANYDREAGAQDAQRRVTITRNSNSITLPDDPTIVGTEGAFVPGHGWRNNNINFETAWAENNNELAEPVKVIAFDFTNNTIFAEQNITGANTNLGNIPQNSALKVFFAGRVNYRTLERNNDKDIDGCKSGNDPANNCNITLERGGTPYENMMIYTPPTLSSQVLLLPPLGGAGNGNYEITIRGNQAQGIRSYLGEPPRRATYTIRFTAN